MEPHAAEAETLQTLGEIEKLMCEHQIRQMDCDECRYELGWSRSRPIRRRRRCSRRRRLCCERWSKTQSLVGHLELDLGRTAEVAAIGVGRVETIRQAAGRRCPGRRSAGRAAQPGVRQGQGRLSGAAAQWDLAQTTFQREQQLHDNKVSSAAVFQQSQNEYRRAQAAFISAERLLESYGLSGEKIKQLREITPDGDFYHLSLTAPISGTILQQNFIQGQESRPNRRSTASRT